MSPRVLAATSLENYRVQLSFSNGEKRSLDMSPYLSFGVFSRLKNQDIFRDVRVTFGTIEWPCGVDLDPDFVWEKSEPLLVV
ncbi:MAG: DUF2442 domain-containing protein [Fibrobacteres bacterium]|nr:DUF2442 domain-containing protein [Fibrobacterota bacterium]